MAKANNVDLELVETDPLGGKFPDGYAEINPLMKIPAFQAKDGYLLTEAIAIAIYSKSLLLHLPLSRFAPSYFPMMR